MRARLLLGERQRRDGEPRRDRASVCSLNEPVRAARWELSVGMQPLSTAPHAGGGVCLTKVEEGWEGPRREGGGQRGRSGNIPPSYGVCRGRGGGRGPEEGLQIGCRF